MCNYTKPALLFQMNQQDHQSLYIVQYFKYLSQVISNKHQASWFQSKIISKGNSETTLQGKSHLCIHFLGIARPQSQFPHLFICERFIHSQDRSTYFPAAESADQSWKYIDLSQICEFRNWETEHYNSVLALTVSFLGIHKWEPDIYVVSHRPFICSVHPLITKKLLYLPFEEDSCLIISKAVSETTNR